ncbi:MAG: acyl-CoA thioesterase [Negativicutes bacterium]|jgi:acyl-CoA thioesterase YciA
MTKEKLKILKEPLGELALRTIAMPANTNGQGDVFGGWLMSQMDLAGGIACSNVTKAHFTTVAVNSMRFWHPVQVGSIISVFCKLKRIGRTSMAFLVNVWATDLFTTNEQLFVTEAEFVYVAIDENGVPKAISEVDKAKAAVL